VVILTGKSMELTRQAGNDPPLVGLMRVYKDYYPDVIVGDVTSGRASVFTVGRSDILHEKVLNQTQHPNQEWRARLLEIRDTYLQKTQDTLPPEKGTFRVTRRRANDKHATTSVIPEVRTSHAQEVSHTVFLQACI
jgi:centromere protein I